MPATDLVQRGAYVMTVCNACRYCEQYCPVFPAMERRVTFAEADLAYLANLCHNCGECLYACQYAPPHEFGINVPATLDALRLRSYETYAWPRAFGMAFKANGIATAIATALSLSAMGFAGVALGGANLFTTRLEGDFYRVLPYPLMVGLFGIVGTFVLMALGIGARRFARHVSNGERLSTAAVNHSIRDSLTLRHLHAAGDDCTTAEEVRTPWRRWFHHATFYGFGLCFASTSVAAVYHEVFGWRAPYGYLALPVVLGTLGGVLLMIGTAGLLVIRRRRDPTLSTRATRELDEAFLVLLLVTAVSGLMLLALRGSWGMPALLLLHLGAVLALFVTLPYGKFVHGIYRVIALRKFYGEPSTLDL